MVIVEINENGFKTTGTTDPSLEGFMAANMSAILFSAAQSATETMHKLNPAFKTSWETNKIFGGICATLSPSDEAERQQCEGMGLLLLHGCVALARLYPDQVQVKGVNTKEENEKCNL